MTWTKRIASRLDPRTQQELRRAKCALAMRRGAFVSLEPEYALLPSWIHAEDWVLDLGANVGHYTARLSALVGPAGRVIAIEPVPETFEVLASNVARLPHRNVTLLNAAASDRCGMVSMSTPYHVHGLLNYYQSRIDPSSGGGTSVLTLAVDGLQLPTRVALMKMDVEGHELAALRGARQLLARDHPVLIVEGRDPEVAEFLAEFAYTFTQLPNSPNRVFTRRATTEARRALTNAAGA